MGRGLPLIAFALAMVVVLLGAYVRLSDAGLGCPDWPGCYGRLAVPTAPGAVADANAAFPDRPVESGKAWKEMIHRYAAGILGLAVLAIFLRSWTARPGAGGRNMAAGLLALIVFQALLGMWTVTLLLKPLVVMAHLLGGLAVLVLLWLLVLDSRHWPDRPAMIAPWPSGLKTLAVVALIGLTLQIILGGWTSANYAALACTGFPKCSGEWWPATDFGEAFVPWRGLGIDYDGGVLEHPARAAIHLTHRLGALIIFLIVGGLGIWLTRLRQADWCKWLGQILLLALVVQVGLGISNVIFYLPLSVAVAHNGFAAALLLAVATVNYALAFPKNPRYDVPSP